MFDWTYNLSCRDICFVEDHRVFGLQPDGDFAPPRVAIDDFTALITNLVSKFSGPSLRERRDSHPSNCSSGARSVRSHAVGLDRASDR